MSNIDYLNADLTGQCSETIFNATQRAYIVKELAPEIKALLLKINAIAPEVIALKEGTPFYAAQGILEDVIAMLQSRV